MNVDDRIASFRIDLRNREPPDLVQRHITSGPCVVLEESRYLELRQRVAQHFHIHPSQVIVVGSAKLGFSIVEQKRYRPFGDNSDIDVALASSELFDLIWREVFDHWARGERWSGLDDFRKYVFRGWMRPDKLPSERSFERSREWWEFFRSLTASGRFGPYRVTGALYKNWNFLETYHEKCVRDCRAEETLTP